MARTKDPHAATVKAWETRKRGSLGDRERRLLGPVSKVKEQKGGVSDTFKVTLEDGTEGNFKLRGRHTQYGTPEAEVAAWEVAKLVGMDDMVPAAAVRAIESTTLRGPLDGVAGAQRDGSFAEWQEGTVANKLPLRARGPLTRPVGGRFGDSEHDVKRTAMFDWVTGQGDRHSGNWVVDDGQVRLIDHNLAFKPGSPRSMFLDLVAFGSGGTESPAAYIKPYLDKLPHILAVLREVGDSQGRSDGKWITAVDFDARARALEARVHRAASAKTWRDLT